MKDVVTRFLDIAEAFGAAAAPSVQVLAVYLPDKDKRGRRVRSHGAWVKRAMRVLSCIGNGATAFPPADGAYLPPERRGRGPEALADSDLIWERTTYAYTYVDPEAFQRYAKQLRQLLHDFGRETGQSEVVFEFDEEFYRIQTFDVK